MWHFTAVLPKEYNIIIKRKHKNMFFFSLLVRTIIGSLFLANLGYFFLDHTTNYGLCFRLRTRSILRTNKVQKSPINLPPSGSWKWTLVKPSPTPITDYLSELFAFPKLLSPESNEGGKKVQIKLSDFALPSFSLLPFLILLHFPLLPFYPCIIRIVYT